MSKDEIIKSIETAIVGKRADDLRLLFTKYPDFIHCESGAGTWLHRAASRGTGQIVKLILDLGVNADAEWHIGGGVSTPLDCALDKEDVEIGKLLLESGANPNSGRKIIGAVQASKALELVQLLEKYGADLHQEFLNVHTGKRMNALSTAVDWGKEDVAEYLRSRGCVMPGQAPHAAK